MKYLMGIAITLACLLAGQAGNAGAAEETCTTQAGDKAETAIDDLHSWAKLYRWYQLYRACDNGAPGEGVSEAVSQLLVRHWSGVIEVRSALKDEPGFSAFVINHVDTTWDWDNAGPARENAAHHCPDGLADFCAAVVGKIDDINAHPSNY